MKTHIPETIKARELGLKISIPLLCTQRKFYYLMCHVQS